ncbi:MAG: purine-nucleoside phosphorylase [Candidatus Melainabacteria bacterium]|nr:purine-nucleoside phosphorylase [Candidatus Melainabacteria bacterium]
MLLLQKTKHLLLKRFTKLKIKPQIAIITGSGVKLFNDRNPSFEMKYNELPIWSISEKKQGVKGHEGKLKLYKVKDKGILVFSGRRHLYEGLSITDVVSNIRLAYESGIQKMIITNAAGGIDRSLNVGDLMLISGFINLMQATERGVLDGIVQPPKQIKTKLTKLIQTRLKKHIKTGIYASELGPSYETFSEIRLLQKLGASAVGMSTIPEMICAKSLGLDFAGISIISNVWDKKHKPSHKEVLEHVNKANEKLNDLILKIIANV